MTLFKYVCFISYRNGNKIENRLNEFTLQFADVISKNVEGFLKDSNVQDQNQNNVFLDQYIFPDMVFDLDVLSRGLCNSIVWIVLFSRNYFSGSHWCASELEGMKRLEEARLKLLEQSKNPDIGFVVPVLITGDEEEMPHFLSKRKKHIVDLKRLFLRKKFEDESEFEDVLAGLLDKIGRAQKVVLDKKVDICAECADFRLVDVSSEAGLEAIKEFVTVLQAPPKPVN